MFGSRRVEERCKALEAQLGEAQRKLDALVQWKDLEWNELLDKVNRWMQRTTARDRAEQRKVGAAPAAPAELFPGVDPASARVLAQRMRMRGRPMGVVPQQEREGPAADETGVMPFARAEGANE